MMETWGNLILFNAASATVLAGVVAMIAPRTKRPSLVHGLWLLVLLKLVSVPALEIPLLPSIETLLPSEPLVASVGPTLDVVSTPETVATKPTNPGLGARAALVLTMALGAAGLLSLAGWRVHRFRRLLRHASEAPPGLQQRAARLAAALGLAYPPPIRIVPDRIPPAVWPALGRSQILLPARLLDRLSADELDTLLAHELAHIRRRDHWVRPFELLITAFYWWHPVTWWARRNLRLAEEKSCDELVLDSLPGHSRAYAESLLKTVEFLSTREDRIPALAIGAGETHRLKERVVMILNREIASPITSRARVAFAAVALLAMLVSPAWVESKTAHEHQPEHTRAEREYVAKMLAVHREELRLERELHELQAKRSELEHELQSVMFQTEQKRLNEEAEQLLEAGEELQAVEVRRHLEMLQREVARDLDYQRSELLRGRKQTDLELQLRELELSREEMMVEGEAELAREVTEKALAVEHALQALRLETLEAEVQRNHERLEMEADHLREEAEKAAAEAKAD
jgi:beta-lactamase regulating signal transducer with metallopeptidase domain